MKPARLDQEARDELRAAVAWYEERRAGLGDEFLTAVDSAIERIRRGPKAGRQVPRVAPDLGVRSARVQRFPYMLVFVELDRAIRILAVAHDRRRPGYWRKRLR
jgi:plasmid stabilization system protein ParE